MKCPMPHIRAVVVHLENLIKTKESYKNMEKKEFLVQNLTEGKNYQQISDENSVSRPQLTKWWNEGLRIRKEIKRANQLFNARKGNIDFEKFEKLGKRAFYEWYEQQPKRCTYCGIEEEKLQKIFNVENGILHTKRNRGRVLELERKNAKNNEYSPENCAMSCYLCNNHKSDLISEKDHLKYFAKEIYKYLDDKYNELENQK